MPLKKIAYISTYVCNLYVSHQKQAMFTKVRNCYKDYIIVIFLLYYFLLRLLIISHYSSNILSSTKKGRSVFYFAFVFTVYSWVRERTINRIVGKAWHSLSFQDAISDETWFSLLKQNSTACIHTLRIGILQYYIRGYITKDDYKTWFQYAKHSYSACKKII